MLPMPYHRERTISWGHWGITFSEYQPDATLNFPRAVAFLAFPVGTRGPCDMHVSRDIGRRWIDAAELPEGARGYRY